MIIRKARGTPGAPGEFGQQERPAVEVSITRRCGHQETIRIFGDPGTSRYYAAQELLDCRRCVNAPLVSEDNAAVKAGKRVVLEGSERQVEWAQTIRAARAAEYASYVGQVRGVAQRLVLAGKLTNADRDAGLLAVKEAITDLMLGQVDFDPDEFGMHAGHARWWIDHKDMASRAILALILDDRDILGGWFGGGDDDHSGAFILKAHRKPDTTPVPDAWDREADEWVPDPPPLALPITGRPPIKVLLPVTRATDYADLDDSPF